MKYLIALLIGATGLSLQNANAQLLFSEGFNYTPGNDLQGLVNPGGNMWTGGNSGLTIGTGDLTYSGLQNISVNDLSVAWGSGGASINTFANVTSGSVYYSFLLDVTTAPGANDYITSLNPGTTAPGGSADALAIYDDPSGTTGGEIGLRTAGESTTHVGSSLAMALNTTYLVVAQYNFTTASTSLWLDPTIGGSQPAPTLILAGSGTVTSIDDLGYKTQATTGDFLIDNVLVGETWNDVTPIAPVPEPSTFALAGAGLGLMGLIRFRYFRSR
jgi:PEP-CTERM motif